MFVSNTTPIILVTGVAVVNGQSMDSHLVSVLIQNCIFIAGVASLIQIAGIWKIGSRLPIIMGISFTFLAAMMGAASKDYNIAMGAVIVGGCIEGILGLCYKYWKGILSPIVSACVVCGIGLSLFTVGTNSFGGGGSYMPNFGAPLFWIIGGATLITCLVWTYAAKGPIKALSALAGLVVGYVLTVIFDVAGISTLLCGLSAEELAAQGGVYKLIDFSQIMSRGFIGIPQPLPTGAPKFEIGAIVSMTVIFLVSATETIGDSAALCQGDGFTAAGSNEIFKFTPQIVQDIFASNVVAVVFIVAVILNLILPKENK